VIPTHPVQGLVTPAQRTKRAVLAPDDVLPQPNGLVPQWPGRAVRLDGSEIYVRRTPSTSPDAEPAVYVHGLGGSSTNWTDLSALLAGHLDATAIDLPGSGRSDPAVRYSIAAFADRVSRWIEHADRGPVHLVGNSLGGTITVKVAATRPDLVRTLTLISPALPFLNPRRSLQARVLPLLALPRGERLARWVMISTPPERMARQVIEACFADPGVVAEQRFQEAIEEIRLRYSLEHYIGAYLRTMRGLVRGFLRAYLPGDGSLWRTAAAVRAPTLVIGGRQDRLVDIRVAPQTAWAIPDSRLLMLDGVGHVAHMEAPRLVARAMVALLAEPARRPDDPQATPASPATRGMTD
jgi:pimeloyl-ACP methyl ester carboxylesterase